MNESFGGEYFNTTANAGVSGAQTEPKAQGNAPVLIKQILDSDEGNFQMFDMVYRMVECVGIVRGIDTSSTKITYLVEDHTGQIDAHYWLEENDDETPKSPDVMVNNYARVLGTIRQNAGKKNIIIFKMFPVTDINVVTTHLLEVLNARYKAEDFQNTPVSSDFAGNQITNNENNTNSLGLEGKHLAVFEAIKNYVSDEGISLQQLKTKFSHISATELNALLDYMTQEGHVYTSIDSEHFLSTDS